MVEIEGISKTYGGRTQALAGIDLRIPRGTFGLLGPNGAGKTTLMRIIATLLLPTKGRVTVDGHDVVKAPHRIRRRLGYLPEKFGLYDELTAFEFLDYVASLKGLDGVTARDEAIGQALAQTGMSQHTHQVVGTFSAGMRRRIGIAQALIGDPDLLVVDEPTAGLDPEERSRFLSLLSGMGSGRCIILSTHILTDIERVCERVAVLAQGRLRYSGSTAALRELARERVWSVTVPGAEAAELERSGRVVASTPVAEGLRLRMHADEAPFPSAEPAEPRLEDSYLMLLGADREDALA